MKRSVDLPINQQNNKILPLRLEQFIDISYLSSVPPPPCLYNQVPPPPPLTEKHIILVKQYLTVIKKITNTYHVGCNRSFVFIKKKPSSKDQRSPEIIS